MTRALLGSLAGVVFLRVLGVSLLFAGFETHARALGGTTFQGALAFAAYPAALAVFMLPLAALSDRVGRRPVMLGALIVSALGGFGAALAGDIVSLALWRFVQGAGAVNGVALALAGEMGPAERRTSRMAVLGAAAGIGFAAGILLGAWLTPLVGVPWLLAGHSAASLVMVGLLARIVPPAAIAAPPANAASADGVTIGRGRVPRLALLLGGAAFAVNLALTGLLFLSPLLIRGMPYALAITLMVLPGGLGMFLAARLADAGRARAVGVIGAALLGLAPLPFVLGSPPAAIVLAGVAFFVGHSSLTSLLPSLAAAGATEGRRGFAQGVQSTLQYLGSAVGAALVGALYPSAGAMAALFLVAGLAVAAAILAVARPTPRGT